MSEILKHNFERAMEYYKSEIVDENDPHIQKYQEQLYACYLMRADMIDFDCWTHYIELLDDPTIDFGEYIELDNQFGGSIEDVTTEDTKTIADLKEMLSNLRKYEGNDSKELELIKEDGEIYNQEESQELDEDYEM